MGIQRHIWTQHIQPEQLADLAKMIPLVDDRRQRISVQAPFTEEHIGSVPACNAVDVEKALSRARTAQRSWSQTPPLRRKTILLNYHEMVLQRQDELLDLIQIESGKARIHALEEIMDVAINCRHYGYRAANYLRPQRRKGILPGLTSTWEVRHPWEWWGSFHHGTTRSLWPFLTPSQRCWQETQLF